MTSKPNGESGLTAALSKLPYHLRQQEMYRLVDDNITKTDTPGGLVKYKPGWSDTEIARMTGFSEGKVGAYRGQKHGKLKHVRQEGVGISTTAGAVRHRANKALALARATAAAFNTLVARLGEQQLQLDIGAIEISGEHRDE